MRSFKLPKRAELPFGAAAGPTIRGDASVAAMLGGSGLKVALLCSGLGHVARGHEVFAQGLFDLLRDSLDITLLKGGGAASPREWVIPNVPRNSPLLDHIHVPQASRWATSIREQERQRIEHEGFAYAAIGPLLAGDFDVVHCLEQEVCTVLHANRHLFRRTPKIVFANGGAIPGPDLPPCDFVQEHTEHNLHYSDRRRAFMIPHGVDLTRFHPDVGSDFRARHGISADALVVISVGTIGVNHKRMDHVIREVAPLPHIHLVIVGQESGETAQIKALGAQLLGPRVTFTKVAHADLPQALAAANVFVLGSLFETFGIAYIEAMAMGLPVICTQHPNQRLIVKQGVFIDMKRSGELTRVLRDTPAEHWQALGRRGLQVVREHYDLQVLRGLYLQHYQRIAQTPTHLPEPGLIQRLRGHARHAWKSMRNSLLGTAR
ncbi:glycosyltransferase family 4 protein [Ideonella sp. DXS22W]|uniref:Glycosyltransferase family 4 protein n=1 Tax=Pseudaquabacterium inlustre TaxID=2984192 RepID=A0ABU9CRG2_9BURK